jgi:hypothetical protein
VDCSNNQAIKNKFLMVYRVYIKQIKKEWREYARGSLKAGYL